MPTTEALPAAGREESEWGVVVGQVGRHLTYPVDEDEIEEQFKGGYLMARRIGDEATLAHGSIRKARCLPRRTGIASRSRSWFSLLVLVTRCSAQCHKCAHVELIPTTVTLRLIASPITLKSKYS